MPFTPDMKAGLRFPQGKAGLRRPALPHKGKAGLRRLFLSTRIAPLAYASSRIFALRRLLWRAALFLWIRPRAA